MDIWIGPKGAIGVRLSGGIGSPCWDHWAIILHDAAGKHLRIKLSKSGAKRSKDGKWKFVAKFKKLRVTDLAQEFSDLVAKRHALDHKLERLGERLGYPIEKKYKIT